MKGTDLLTIGDLSERTGLSVSAIRFYEEKGLVHPSRNAGGQRRFLRADIRRLSFVLVAQEFGFSIAEIAAQLQRLPEGRAPTKADWTRISRDFRSHLDRKIERMTALRNKLDGCIGCGCLSMKTCQLYNAGDAAASKGRGPRYLLGDRPDFARD
ncbi:MULTISPECIES: redox-sensitive transcriptional activator SoxR [Stappiaceae]|jgi:MerR family redox-sensitive transcriptional activator SoxR|uniref:redox-sensitive transcriptional activator SoxR n=1 Tax=Stappiaceae TaxID=2821832 RepID=UPI00094AB0FC|nr:MULTISPECIES: redox-sensitive transcriptional activator SoxR [Stappiaceae]MCR9280204.1 redox-sensitive transcriptional activator SoxR [Paracoccaceae bacterium]MEC9422498.1 redox-sensitive transcriptional activator SoxR [Pseudomonadota bacterium]MBN8180315.1 redox-sensitive transcriptional activator SoxR [Roseibium aggregatum]MEC9468433.1 redox-sensitive transcriptional activator SoxR [Pseudomonadota bacterium]MEE2868247.1 redox-sensitive transcriptional activator SoxR [Pseudomonadota bacter